MSETKYRKISAESARSDTRSDKQSSSSCFPSSGMFGTLLVVILVGISAWVYKTIQPPPPKICGSPGGPPITAPRIKLRDGRYLAYKEHGVPKDDAVYKIVYVHGGDSCRHDVPFATLLSPEISEELGGIYIVSFDRPGYGESDPDPNRTPKSIAMDIQELADQLNLGSKFYIIGFSMGAQATWGCVKYIPYRLAGVTLVAPVVNYWWHNIPSDLSSEAYNLQPRRDRWALRVVHYAPWLVYWWNTQRWFPGSSVAGRDPNIFSRQDKEIISKMPPTRVHEAQIRQQGVQESVYRDMIVGFGKWEFDPLDLDDPFSDNKEGFSLDLWQGDEDILVPVTLQRYIGQKLPWVRYHEVAGGGHIFMLAEGMVDRIMKTMLSG